MSPGKLRLLAECLENNFITAEDRHGWINDLRGFAKSMERERDAALSPAAESGKEG